MPSANILIHQSAYYRKHVYKQCFEKNGFRIIDNPHNRPGKDDALLIWNRNKKHEAIAKRYEDAGAKVFVTENGYVGDTKALALNHHSGAGTWHVGTEDRWSKLGIELKEWRKSGEEILVLPQRSIGEPQIAMPRNWETEIVKKLRALTDRPIRVRKHPGKDRTAKPIEEDFVNTWACITWASGAGIKAIIQGIPVFHNLKNWIGAPAATTELDIENPWMGDRLPMLKRLAWAQWTWDEFRSGEPVKWLMQ